MYRGTSTAFVVSCVHGCASGMGCLFAHLRSLSRVTCTGDRLMYRGASTAFVVPCVHGSDIGVFFHSDFVGILMPVNMHALYNTLRAHIIVAYLPPSQCDCGIPSI
jgi:hypothetical protein